MRKVSLLLAFSIILLSFASLVYAVGPTIQAGEVEEIRAEEADSEEDQEGEKVERELEKEDKKEAEVVEAIEDSSEEDPNEEKEEDETKDLEEISEDDLQVKNSENSEDEKEDEKELEERDLEEELEVLEEEVPEESLDNSSGYLGPDDEYARWELDDSGLLKIYGGKMAETRADGNRSWEEHAKDITSIEIGEEDKPLIAAKNMSGYFFVKKSEIYENKMTELLSIDASHLDTSKTKDMSYMFQGLTQLEDLVVGSWNTGNVKSMEGMFSGLSYLENIDVEAWDVSKLETMDFMFNGMKEIKELDLSAWRPAQLKHMQAAFQDMEKLETLKLEGWETPDLDNMNQVFSGVSSLKKLDLAHFDVSKVISMDGTFEHMFSLTDLDISGWNTKGPRGSNPDNQKPLSMEGMFNYANLLERITLGENSLIDGSGLTIVGAGPGNLYSGAWLGPVKSDESGERVRHENSTAFMANYDGSQPGTYFKEYNTYNVNFKDGNNIIKTLKSQPTNGLVIQEEIPTTAMKPGQDFKDWVDDATDEYFNPDLAIDKDLNLVAQWTKDDENIKDSGYLGPNSSFAPWILYEGGLLKIGGGNMAETRAKGNRSWEQYAKDITSIEIGEEDKPLIAAKDMSQYFLVTEKGKFKNIMTEVISIDASHLDTSKTEDMSYMFQGLTQLENLVVGSWNTGNVKSMEGMFSGLSYLENIDVGAWDVSKLETMAFMFFGMKEIKSLDLSGWRPEQLKKMQAAFQDMEKLEILNLEGWEVPDLDNMNQAFSGVSSLKKLDLEHFNVSKVIGMYGTFEHMHALTDLNIKGWKTEKVKTMDSMFRYAIGLKELDLSHFKTDKLESMKLMFEGMVSLRDLDISGWNTKGPRGWDPIENKPLNEPLNMEGMFNYTNLLERITLGKDSLINGSGLTIVGAGLGNLYNGAWLGPVTSDESGERIRHENSTAFMADYDGSQPGTYFREYSVFQINFKDGNQTLKILQSDMTTGRIKNGVAPSPSKPGYRFLGWTKDDSTDLVDVDRLLADIIYEPMVLNAKWERIGSGSSGGGGSSSRDRSQKEESRSDAKQKIEAEIQLGKKENLLNMKDHMAYITGYSDGSIRAEANLTREELASVIYKILNPDYHNTTKPGKIIYRDLVPTRWSNQYINTLAEMGLVSGYPDGSYKPANYISRGEFAAVVARFLPETSSNGESFTDIENHWAKESINLLAGQGLIDGHNGKFRPNDRLSRGEMVKIINKLLDRNLKPGELPAARKIFKDLDPAKWYYWDIEEAANAHHYKKSSDGEVWTELLDK